MAYRTYVIINVEAFDASVEKTSDAYKVFRDIMEKAGCLQYQINDDSAEFEDNNNGTIGIITELTKDHPGLILQGTIDGTSEDSFDYRAFRIRAGCIEEVQAQYTFPDFTTILTDEEKEALPDPSKEKKNIGTTLSDSLEALKGITTSGYWPYRSPAPCSTEVKIKKNIDRAIDYLSLALIYHKEMFEKTKRDPMACMKSVIETKK